MMTRGQNNRVIAMWAKKDVLCLSALERLLSLPSQIFGQEGRIFFFSECSSEKQTHVGRASFFEGKWRQIWTSMSRDQQIRFCHFCPSSRAQLRFRLHLLSGPRERCADAVLDWLGAFWLVASLESLVHCCLLESLGSQRRASLLENKSKWDFFSSYGGGGGVFNFLAA